MSFKGSLRLLEIEIDGGFKIAACLEEHNFSEESDLLPTTTRDNGGWDTVRPTTQRYSIDFAGRQVNTKFPGGDLSLISYDQMIELKRNRVMIPWRISSTDDNMLVEQGCGYITSLSEGAVVDEFVNFTGVITGFGSPSLFTLTSILSPLSGSLFNLADGAALSTVSVIYSGPIIKNITINGVITNTTTMATLDINDANTSISGGTTLDIDTTGFFATAAVYDIFIDYGAVYDAKASAISSPAITGWTIEVRPGDYADADYDTNDYFTD